MISFQSVGGFGKIPTQGDFLRIGAPPPGFDQWLAEGLEGIRRGQGALPQTPLSFLYRSAGARQALLGVMHPSVDSVGRQFPLCLYGVVDAAAIAEAFPLAPVACARFLGAAGKLVQAAAGLSAADLSAKVSALPTPTSTDVAVADDLRRNALATGRNLELVERLFAGAPPGRQYYAFRTFLAACEPARGQESEKPGVTIDCPVQSELDRLAWLELAARVLKWRAAPPTLLWADPPPSRVLLSLGPAPASLLVYWAKPDHSAQKLWPLHTDRTDAIVQAAQALRPMHRTALESDLELERFLTSLAG
jgi:type VI secretion system protein ImpM